MQRARSGCKHRTVAKHFRQQLLPMTMPAPEPANLVMGGGRAAYPCIGAQLAQLLPDLTRSVLREQLRPDVLPARRSALQEQGGRHAQVRYTFLHRLTIDTKHRRSALIISSSLSETPPWSGLARTSWRSSRYGHRCNRVTVS